jgi:hypothetical protein
MQGFMPIGDYKVTYVDGRVESTTSNFLGLAEIERRWPGDQVPGVQAIATAVWFYLGCPGENLDAWMATVHLVEQAEPQETVQEVPTQAEPGAA